MLWEVEAHIEYPLTADVKDEDVRVLVAADNLLKAVEMVIWRCKLSGNACVTIKTAFPSDITHILE